MTDPSFISSWGSAFSLAHVISRILVRVSSCAPCLMDVPFQMRDGCSNMGMAEIWLNLTVAGKSGELQAPCTTLPS